jgi:hypothetical protein
MSDSSPETERRGGRATAFLIGLVLLSVAVIVIAFVPLISCDFCYGEGVILVQKDRDAGEMSLDPCALCKGRGRKTVLRALISRLQASD